MNVNHALCKCSFPISQSSQFPIPSLSVSFHPYPIPISFSLMPSIQSMQTWPYASNAFNERYPPRIRSKAPPASKTLGSEQGSIHTNKKKNNEKRKKRFLLSKFLFHTLLLEYPSISDLHHCACASRLQVKMLFLGVDGQKRPGRWGPLVTLASSSDPFAQHIIPHRCLPSWLFMVRSIRLFMCLRCVGHNFPSTVVRQHWCFHVWSCTWIVLTISLSRCHNQHFILLKLLATLPTHILLTRVSTLTLLTWICPLLLLEEMLLLHGK